MGVRCRMTRVLILMELSVTFGRFVSCQKGFYPQYYCHSGASFPDGSTRDSNLQTLMNDLVDTVNAREFSNSVAGNESDDAVYGMIECTGYDWSDTCYRCAMEANAMLRSQCGNYVGARIWLQECFLRWEIYNFSGILDESGWYAVSPSDVFSPVAFDTDVRGLLKDLSKEASSKQRGRRYTTGNVSIGESSIVAGFVHCWHDISAEDCEDCLSYAFDFLMERSHGKEYGLIEFGSCIMRYLSVTYADETSSTVMSAKRFMATLLAVMIGILFLAAVVLIVILQSPVQCLKRRVSDLSDTSERKIRTVEVQFPPPKKSWAKDAEQGDLEKREDNVIFSLTAILSATNNFDEQFKLGEGAYSVVYKGTLPNGRHIAVKRLDMQPSLRGIEQLTNETKILTEFHHRNLVKLLGYCAEGTEAILIYEYVPRKSLDKLLSDSEGREKLDWPVRFNIILGVAQGLSYLHDYGKLRIVHRDIKASCILLDDDLQPKIAGFGFAKLFQDDKAHIPSQLVGTWGYIAPEYLLEGEISSKTDVYSFGVLMLEIISGRRNAEQQAGVDVPSLVNWVWKLQEQENLWEMVDESLKERSTAEDVVRMIQIGLLCTQEKANRRPSMSEIITMISDSSVALPTPESPPDASLC